jgi:hypothetical protein
MNNQKNEIKFAQKFIKPTGPSIFEKMTRLAISNKSLNMG